MDEILVETIGQYEQYLVQHDKVCSKLQKESLCDTCALPFMTNMRIVVFPDALESKTSPFSSQFVDHFVSYVIQCDQVFC